MRMLSTVAVFMIMSDVYIVCCFGWPKHTQILWLIKAHPSFWADLSTSKFCADLDTNFPPFSSQCNADTQLSEKQSWRNVAEADFLNHIISCKNTLDLHWPKPKNWAKYLSKIFVNILSKFLPTSLFNRVMLWKLH